MSIYYIHARLSLQLRQIFLAYVTYRNSIYFALIESFCKICFVIIRLAIFFDKICYEADMKSEIMILANID